MNKLVIISILFASLLTACASSPPYRPADGARYGFSETRIAEDRYRVSFKAPASREADVRDYALLRAAEVTLLEGYDWFVVLDRETAIERPEPRPSVAVGASRAVTSSSSCGLLACRTYYHPVRAYGADLDSGAASRGSARSELEIRLGKGVRPEGADSLDAVEVRDNLRQSLEIESGS